MEIADNNSFSKEESSLFNAEHTCTNIGRKRKLSITTLVSSPVLSSLPFLSSHLSPSSRSQSNFSSSQQEQQLSPICTLSELLRSEYDPTSISSSSSYKTHYNNDVDDDDDCSNSYKSSTTLTMSKKQRQQQYYHQQQQQVAESIHHHHHHHEDDDSKSSLKAIAIVSPLSSPKDEQQQQQHNKKRVHFSMTEPQQIPPSAYSNIINTDPGHLKQSWYTQKEYVTFFQDRQDTIKLWYKAKNLDLIHEFIARSNEYCLRGLESYYQSITSNDAKRRHRSTHRYYVFLHQQLLKHTTTTNASCTKNHIHSTSCLPSLSTTRSESVSMISDQLQDDVYDSNSDISVTDTLSKQNQHVQDVVERMSSYSMSRAQILAEWDEQDAMFIHYFNIPTVATGTPEIQKKIDHLHLYDQDNYDIKNISKEADRKQQQQPNRTQHERRNSIMNNIRFQDRMNKTKNSFSDHCSSSSTKKQEQNRDQYELKDERKHRMHQRHEQLQSFVTMATSEECFVTTNCRRRRKSHHHYRHPKSTVFPPKLYPVCDDISAESLTHVHSSSCQSSIHYDKEPGTGLCDESVVDDDNGNKKTNFNNNNNNNNNNIDDNEYNFVQMHSKNNTNHKKQTRRKHRLLPSDSIVNIPPVLLSLVTKTTTAPIYTIQTPPTTTTTAETMSYFDDVATMNHLEIVEV